MIWKEMTLVYFKALPHLPGGTEEEQEESQDFPYL
jgi:hypothetical protein